MREPRVAQCAFKPFNTSGQLFGVDCQNSTACEAQRQRLAACLLPLSVFALAEQRPAVRTRGAGQLEPGASRNVCTPYAYQPRVYRSYRSYRPYRGTPGLDGQRYAATEEPQAG